ncbi:Fic family protein [Mediterraneibacter gnavus]|uniref:Fic family protein n=1 Tax=Mediterraneibacter gnavus TaxID=33038 RepID=UPI003CCC659D
MSIHRKLFRGIYNHAGKIRDYNITKKEWVLDGATVMYGSASELRATLEYDFSQEKDFSYRGLSMDEIIHHLAVFISRLWQIHIFADHAWYFRNALVRANYTNLQKNIHETTVHIHRLFEKFGFDEVFGRSAVMELLQLKSSGASKLISNLVQSDIIEPVSGHGKGKYKFRK